RAWLPPSPTRSGRRRRRQSQSRSRGSGGPRRGPPRFGGGRPDRRGFDGRDRRPVLTRTNDGEDVPQLVGEGVYGIHSVLQALESGHRETHALYMREEQTVGSGPRPKKSAADVRALERIKELAAAGHVDVNTTSKWMLNHITGDKPHQARRTGNLTEEGCVCQATDEDTRVDSLNVSVAAAILLYELLHH
ncbi:hypothetical protein BBJ28_00008880, partial [Nothophytophthora sp. Chile5]